MKKIHGKILLRETGEGIANLVVAAFDAEIPWKEISALREAKKATTLRIEQLGKRIGSVLTDRDGRFVLHQEDLKFEGVESRPDVIVAVFAPEDILDADDPFPKSAEDRLLYVSATPRNDAGWEEAFLIRLLRTQLEKFKIYGNAALNQSHSDSRNLSVAIENTWSFREDLQHKSAERAKKEKEKTDAFKAAAKRKVETLSAIPLHLRDGREEKNVIRNNSLLVNGKKELADKLNNLQLDAIQHGLERIGKTKPTLRLRLNRNDLDDLRLKAEKGKISGKVDPKQLLAKLATLINGVDLIRTRGLNNPSPDVLEAKYLHPDNP